MREVNELDREWEEFFLLTDDEECRRVEAARALCERVESDNSWPRVGFSREQSFIPVWAQIRHAGEYLSERGL